MTPLPSVTEPCLSRLWVPAATVVIHGLGWATVPDVGPLLPAEAATKTPASAAPRAESGNPVRLQGELRPARAAASPSHTPVRPGYPWMAAITGMSRIATMFAILIIGLIAGPAVSL